MVMVMVLTASQNSKGRNVAVYGSAQDRTDGRNVGNANIFIYLTYVM